MVLRETAWVIERLRWMRERRVWPNGRRYLWTDAFGVVLLVSLHEESGRPEHLDEAEWVVAEVERVLGRPRGVRIGEAPDRDGQYFHYLAMWIHALGLLGRRRPKHRQRAIELVREIHAAFVVPGVGVHWKMLEDLSAPYPGFGFGGLDPFHGLVVYRRLAEVELASEIEDLRRLVAAGWRSLAIDQDLGLGMMLWMTHFFPGEPWAVLQAKRCLDTLETMWIDPPGWFCRQPGVPWVKFAFTNYGVSLGLQSIGKHEDRVRRLNGFFATWRSGDHYDEEAITHVMACTSHLPGAFV